MKKISIIVMALVFLVALTQCKKEQATPVNDGKTVDITLDIKSGNGTRMDVNTSTGEVTYVSGDKIYVASGGKYVGTLTHNGTRFSGAISDPTVGEPLHFYFLGNVTPAETLTAGTTTTCSVVISDQTEHLPVIEYAPSNETYTAGATTFTAHLLNKCALVKFNVTTSSEAATCITGMKNKVTVSFADNTLTHSQEGNGLITLPSGSGEKWAILLPQETMEEGSAYSEDGEYTGTHGVVPAIYDNGYLIEGIEVNVIAEVNPGDVPVGAINGKFTINADGDQVYFSQGNLQYIYQSNGGGTIQYWKFVDNQWDYGGHFGWGTSGWNCGNRYYKPNDFTNECDGGLYGPPGLYNLTGSYANSDWGVYNRISNGGNQSGLWRTLNKDEWEYVLFGRNTLSNIHFAKVQINDIKGLIVLPDSWNISTFSLNNVDQLDAGFDSNLISMQSWNALESNGVVFLPAAGERSGTTFVNTGSTGWYWTASYYDRAEAYDLTFGEGSVHVYWDFRFNGLSVRLVQNVE